MELRFADTSDRAFIALQRIIADALDGHLMQQHVSEGNADARVRRLLLLSTLSIHRIGSRVLRTANDDSDADFALTYTDWSQTASRIRNLPKLLAEKGPAEKAQFRARFKWICENVSAEVSSWQRDFMFQPRRAALDALRGLQTLLLHRKHTVSKSREKRIPRGVRTDDEDDTDARGHFQPTAFLSHALCGIELRAEARVPLLRLYLSEGTVCDITVAHASLLGKQRRVNELLDAAYEETDCCARTVVRRLKRLFKMAHLIDSLGGAWNSFCVTLMCIAAVRRHAGAIRAQQSPRERLRLALLSAMMDIYALSQCCDRYYVSATEAPYFLRREARHTGTWLVEDPLDSDDNVGRTCRHYEHVLVIRERLLRLLARYLRMSRQRVDSRARRAVRELFAESRCELDEFQKHDKSDSEKEEESDVLSFEGDDGDSDFDTDYSDCTHDTS
ncbi:MAG: hypothetical protein MHM6MM_004550 [Cercozoa sp. M6MM]